MNHLFVFTSSVLCIRLYADDKIVQTNQWRSQVVGCNFHVRGRRCKEDKPDLQRNRQCVNSLRWHTIGSKAI